MGSLVDIQLKLIIRLVGIIYYNMLYIEYKMCKIRFYILFCKLFIKYYYLIQFVRIWKPYYI